MNSTPRVVFWTTAGVSTGFGHLRRCLSLAESLRAKGAHASFLLDAGQPVAEYVQQQGFEASIHTAPSAVRALRGLGASAVIVDSYETTTADFRALRDAFAVGAIDDLADRELPVDAIINSSPAKAKSDYCALSSTQFLLGPEYALLRPEFGAALPAERVRDAVGRVLITVGGSDPLAITPLLVRSCASVLRNAEIEVVAGPLFDAGLEEEIAVITPAATCHRNPADMRRLMLECDLAVCAGGQTTFELAATGTPAVAIATATNQHGNLAAFDALGVLRWAADAPDVRLAERVREAVERLAGDLNARREMSERGRRAVDGAGANRVAAALVETFNAANQNR